MTADELDVVDLQVGHAGGLQHEQVEHGAGIERVPHRAETVHQVVELDTDRRPLVQRQIGHFQLDEAQIRIFAVHLDLQRAGCIGPCAVDVEVELELGGLEPERRATIAHVNQSNPLKIINGNVVDFYNVFSE